MRRRTRVFATHFRNARHSFLASENAKQASHAGFDRGIVMNDGDADITLAGIFAARIGARGIGARQGAKRRLAPQRQRGSLAIADMEPEKESARRPIKAKAL